MPAYNCEFTIEKAIKSVLNQTFPNFEFIIVNDASTDNTVSKIIEFSDSRIVFINSEINTKKVGAVNKGLQVAKGEYITFIDADDEIDSSKLEIQLSFFDEDKSLGSCFTGYTLSSSIVRNKKWREKYDELKAEFNFEVSDYCFYNTVCATIMIKREIICNVGGYNDFFIGRVGEDFEFCFRIVNHKKSITIPKALYHYNDANNQSITNLTKSSGKLRYDFVFLKELIRFRIQNDRDPLIFDKPELDSFELKVAKKTVVMLSNEIEQIHLDYKNSKKYKLGSLIVKFLSTFKIFKN